jgi:hypothetical protein
MRARAATIAALAALVAPAPAASETPEEERPLDAVAIPADRSPLPKPNEWPAAPRVRPTRRGPAAAGCRAYLLREWMRVRCAGEAFALSLLGGDADGVAFWIDPATKEGEALLPLRRGGRHVVQIWKAGRDATGVFVPEPLVVLQQHWIEGAPAPVVTLF